jgi:3-hydroxy-9,10-secoandrosta-1,3,5(10)-triene-9,17-dione monooxygenase reductase component
VIHGTDPFATPESGRSDVRRLRGRFASTVTLWTAPGPAGLTVSSTLVADGEPGRVLGIVDDESPLWEAIERAGVFTVAPLAAGPAQQQLADRFAGMFPAPGGLFAQEEWAATSFGPVLARQRTWAGCRLDTARPFGWGLLVEGTLVEIHVGDDGSPLLHHRGSYGQLGSR